jgi:hypothetical protein
MKKKLLSFLCKIGLHHWYEFDDRDDNHYRICTRKECNSKPQKMTYYDHGGGIEGPVKIWNTVQ